MRKTVPPLCIPACPKGPIPCREKGGSPINHQCPPANPILPAGIWVIPLPIPHWSPPLRLFKFQHQLQSSQWSQREAGKRAVIYPSHFSFYHTTFKFLGSIIGKYGGAEAATTSQIIRTWHGTRVPEKPSLPNGTIPLVTVGEACYVSHLQRNSSK